MKKNILAYAISFAVLISTPSLAADIQGSQDYPLIKRYEGSEIIGYKSPPYDSYTLMLDNHLKTSQMVEGAIKRYVYSIPKGHSTLEIFRNYEQALTEAKFQILYESLQDNDTLFNPVFNQSDGNNDFASFSSQKRYLAAKISGINNKDVYVSLLVIDNNRDGAWGSPWRNPDVADIKRIPLPRGEVFAILDVIEDKAMENKMVFVKSSEMADAINKTGKIDIYGITFDIDKADIKPESVPTLAEVAKLLQENPVLKLEISGHTDSTGSAPHNQTLSEGRASAVVNALVAQYHVDASRLVAKGYGDTKPIADNATEDGRAKNRRVELTKLQ